MEKVIWEKMGEETIRSGRPSTARFLVECVKKNSVDGSHTLCMIKGLTQYDGRFLSGYPF